jgi:hypothetical protein
VVEVKNHPHPLVVDKKQLGLNNLENLDKPRLEDKGGDDNLSQQGPNHSVIKP